MVWSIFPFFFFFPPVHVSCRLTSCLLDRHSLHPKSIFLQPFLCLLLLVCTLCLHVMYVYVFSCLPVSVRFPLWAGNRFVRVRDAVPLLHRPALRPSAALHPPHSAAVHPQRDQHSEIHQVRCHMLKCMLAYPLCVHTHGLEVQYSSTEAVGVSLYQLWYVCRVMF